MRLHRLIAMLLLMESRGKMKASELAAALETSVRSIYRDVDVLAESGIPILSTPGPNGGISLMEGYTLQLKQLHGEDVVHLYLTGMGIHTAAGSESGLKLKSALLKLEKTLPPAYQEDVTKAKQRFYFDDTPWWIARAIIPCLEALRLAVWRTRAIEIQYRKIDGSESIRLVHPYGLVVKLGDWYLVAYCLKAREIRTFKCERVVAVKLLEDPYTIPGDFSLEEHWHSQQQNFKQARKVAEQYEVILKVDLQYVQALGNLEIINVVEKGEQQLLTVNMYDYESACNTAMKLMGYAEIVEPVVLREFVKERIFTMSRKYIS
ncbi:helix-turn-helix transcriptional regulator [Paenibacillus sp. GCM10012306]|uniref:helix-turn-helix transcriptional regulator n=1 Tax=Paenibacillus sp. GCM10012306 TaxID=3317342 RepID=UPI00360702E1